MTAERMESDNAARQAARMHSEVKASARLAAPPRMPLPRSARESLESPADPFLSDDSQWLFPAVSARAATAEGGEGGEGGEEGNTKDGAQSAEKKDSLTPADAARRMVEAVDVVGQARGSLTGHLSREERNRVLHSLALPVQDRRADAAAAAAASALGLAIAIYVLTPFLTRPSSTYRGNGGGGRGEGGGVRPPLSTTTRRVIDDLVCRVSPPR